MLNRAERRVRLGFVVALTLLAAFALSADYSLRRLREVQLRSSLSREQNEVLRDLRTGMYQAEAALLMLLRNRSAAAGADYDLAVAVQRSALTRLPAIPGMLPEQVALGDSLRQLVNQDTRRGIELIASPAAPPDTLVFQVIAERHRNIRRLVIAIEALDARVVALHEAALVGTLSRARLIMLGASLLGFVIVGWLFLLVHRDLGKGRRLQEELAQNRDHLEARVRERTMALEASAETLRLSEERFRQKVESLPHLVWTGEPDGQCSYLSRRWVEFTGIPVSAQLGTAWLEQVHPEDRAALTERWQHCVATGEELRAEFRLRRHDGSYHWFDSRAVALRNPDGRIIRWFGSHTDIQDVQEAGDALAREQQRLTAIAAVSPAVLHSFRLDTTGHMSFPFVAEGIMDIYGIEGATLREDASGALALFHPDDLPRIRHTIAESAHGMTAWHQRWRMNNPVRGEIWVEGYSAPVRMPDGAIIWHGVLMDVTERVHAEERLHASEGQLQAIIESLSEGLIVADASGTLLHWNPAAIEMHGFTTAEEWQHRLSEFNLTFEIFELDGTALTFEDWPLARLFRGEVLRNLEIRVRRRDLPWERVFSYGGTMVHQAGGRDIAVLTITDVTRRHEMMAELRERSAELQRSNRELEQFAYVASHDLREPLRAVAGCVQLLQNRYRGSLDARADGLIAHAVDGASRMQRLIDDLLALSRVGSRTVPADPTDTDGALREALGNLEHAIEESGAVVQSDPLPPLPIDRSQLTSLFQNLVGNAIKFRGRDAPAIQIRVAQREKEWVFSVRDNGLGIEPQYFERIFGLFQRLHTRAEYPGTGVGLALCQKIVQQAGGRIWLESAPGSGTTFFFSIPATPAASHPHRIAS